MEEDTDYSDTQSPIPSSLPEETMSTQENTVDSTVNTEQQGEGENCLSSWIVNFITIILFGIHFKLKILMLLYQV